MASYLEGSKVERSNEDARMGVPLTAANVRAILAEMERQKVSEAKRRRQALFFAKSAVKITEEGRAAYLEYAAGGNLK